MIKVSLIGKGKVSQHLNNVFDKTNTISVVEVLSSRGDLISKINQNNNAPQVDIYIIAVSDDAIHAVATQLAQTKSLVVHTSGSVSIQMLPEGIRRGVFYPLQSFSENCSIDFKEIPLCIEAEKQEDLNLLNNLAALITNSVFEISSKQRKSLHLAAVFVNNFTNHLYQIGGNICKQQNIPFSILSPLISETARKVENMSPEKAQTGPAIRNDTKTIEAQINQLENENYKKIYRILTDSISKKHEEKL